ncbi:MAG: hypothetical protein Q8L66_11710 [Caulobacter sp.]|nr:hypothetical protein [Caulobacter sp.]
MIVLLPLLLGVANASAAGDYGVPALAAASRPLAANSYSARAADLTSVFVGDGPLVVRSPDGRSQVRVELVEPDAVVNLIKVTGALGDFTFEIVNGPNAELLWAPDSQAFFVTENDGGIVGSYLVYVVARFDGRPQARNLTKLVSDAYGQPGRCFDPEGPNVAGISWLGSSHRLLIAAQTLSHSNCDGMGTFVAFVIDPWAMSVGQRYNQLQAKARFGRDLGLALKASDDDCIRQPAACFIPQLHRRDRQDSR